MTLRLCAGLVAFTLLGCHKMGRVTSSPVDYILSNRPPLVSVTLSDGSSIEIAGPQITGDTLVGFIHGKYYEMPLAALTGMRARQPAPAQTIAVILGVGALVFGGAVFAYTHSGSQPHSECFSIEDDVTTC